LINWSLKKRRKLIEKVKKKVWKGQRGDVAEKRLKFLDCFVNSKITKFKEGAYITPKEKVIRNVWSDDKKTIERWPELLDDTKEIPDKLFKLKDDSIGFMSRFINDKIHGADPDDKINEQCLFYIKSEGRFLYPIFFDFDKIIEAWRDDIKKRRRKEKLFVIRDFYSYSSHMRTQFGTRALEWMTFYAAKDLKCGIDVDNIKIFFNEEEQSVPEKIKESKQNKFDNYLSKTKIEYPYPGPTYGLSNFEFDDATSADNITFYLQPTDYFNFLEVQDYLSNNRTVLEEKIYGRDPVPEFSHSISPTALLLVNDGGTEFAVFAKRTSSDSIHTGAELIGLPICPTPRRKPEGRLMEFFKSKKARKELMEGDDKKNVTMDGSYFVDILKRGAMEELGINLSEDNITILAFGLDTERYLFNIIAIARIEMRIKDLKARKHLTFSGNRQYLDFPKEPYNPEAICEYLSKISPENRCPTTHMATYYALCHDFDVERVAEAFYSLP
jgi:hypothetical protein